MIVAMNRENRGAYTLSAFRPDRMDYKARTGRDHAPVLSVSDGMPEAGGGTSDGVANGPVVAASDGDAGDGDGDGDSDRRRPRSKKSTPYFPPALFGFEPLSQYVGFGRSRIYQLIGTGEFPAPIKIGKSSRWVKTEIDEWISRQSAQRVEVA